MLNLSEMFCDLDTDLKAHFQASMDSVIHNPDYVSRLDGPFLLDEFQVQVSDDLIEED